MSCILPCPELLATALLAVHPIALPASLPASTSTAASTGEGSAGRRVLTRGGCAAAAAVLRRTEFEGYDEDELVRVVVSGNQEPKAIDVTEAAMKLTAEELSARLTAAAKDAHSNSVANMKAKMRDLAGKLGLPQAPGGGLPGM